MASNNQSHFIEVEVADGRKTMLLRKDEIIGVEPVNSWEYSGQPHAKIEIRRASALQSESIFVKQHYETVKKWLIEEGSKG